MKKILFLSLIASMMLPANLLAATTKPIVINVPFTSQAPLAQWSDSRFQDGCEETSSLMAAYWVKGKTIANTASGKKLMNAEIIKIAEYEKKKYGSWVDTSTDDTANRILKNYFGVKTFEVKKNISTQDIINQLEKGRIIIVPTDGQLLGNPNFSNGGPERHNLVIKGYDYANKTFITNDPGTRNGQNYRYAEKVLFNAIRDYPTGTHQKIVGQAKNMIVIWK